MGMGQAAAVAAVLAARQGRTPAKVPMDDIKELLKEKAVIPSVTTGLRRGAFLAELGLKRLEAGENDEPAKLQPVYLRRPSITRAKHR